MKEETTFIHAITWMNLNNIVLSEKNTYKAKNCMIDFLSHSGKGKAIKTELKLVFALKLRLEEIYNNCKGAQRKFLE